MKIVLFDYKRMAPCPRPSPRPICPGAIAALTTPPCLAGATTAPPKAVPATTDPSGPTTAPWALGPWTTAPGTPGPTKPIAPQQGKA